MKTDIQSSYLFSPVMMIMMTEKRRKKEIKNKKKSIGRLVRHARDAGDLFYPPPVYR